MSAGAPTRSAPSPGAPLANRPFGDGLREPVAARDDRLETPAAVQEMAEPQFAHNVVVLVEGRGVDAERDAAAAPDRLADRRDPARQMQVRTRVGRDDRARDSAIRSRSVLARVDAMGERQTRREQPERLQALRRRPRDRRGRRRRADSASREDACARAGPSRASVRRWRRAARPSTIAGRWGRTARRRLGLSTASAIASTRAICSSTLGHRTEELRLDRRARPRRATPPGRLPSSP